MKKENTQVSIAKKKKQIKILCYVSLFFLVVLLFLPMTLRILVKEEEPEEEKKDVVIVLNCNKSNESISSTFLNDEPQNLLYKIKGDHTIVSNPDETTETSMENNLDEVSSVDPNVTPTPFDNSKYVDIGNNGSTSLLELIRSYSTLSYDQASDITSVRTSMSDLKGLSQYPSYFSNVTVQFSYFSSQGFSCTQTEI